VSCGEYTGKQNLITIAWTGTVASDPVMVSIAVRPERYSYSIIKQSGEFVINVPNRRMVRAVDLCGVISGKDCDKFKETGLTPVPAQHVKAPVVAEAPLALECRVSSVIPLGSHDLFLANVLGVQVEEDLVEENGRLNLGKADLISYVHGQYWTLKETVGKFGFSVKKPRRR
jgi:flavin reductase (DIM6/NTAB) family NADH-FMN oxidoreductase RutF